MRVYSIVGSTTLAVSIRIPILGFGYVAAPGYVPDTRGYVFPTVLIPAISEGGVPCYRSDYYRRVRLS